MKTYILRDPNPVEPQTPGRRAMAHKLARSLWHLLKYKEAFNPGVFRQTEEKMQRKKLARLHNTAAALGLKLVPAQ